MNPIPVKDKMEKFVYILAVDVWSRKKPVILIKSSFSHKWSWEKGILESVSFKWGTAVWAHDIDAASSLCSQLR